MPKCGEIAPSYVIISNFRLNGAMGFQIVMSFEPSPLGIRYLSQNLLLCKKPFVNEKKLRSVKRAFEVILCAFLKCLMLLFDC